MRRIYGYLLYSKSGVRISFALSIIAQEHTCHAPFPQKLSIVNLVFVYSNKFAVLYFVHLDYYYKIFEKFGFKLLESEFINIRVSYYVCGIIRKVFNSKDRKEGEPLNLFSVYLQKLTLFFTRPLDVIFKSNKDLARLIYERV